MPACSSLCGSPGEVTAAKLHFGTKTTLHDGETRETEPGCVRRGVLRRAVKRGVWRRRSRGEVGYGKVDCRGGIISIDLRQRIVG